MRYILMYEIAKPTISQQTTDGAWKHIRSFYTLSGEINLFVT